METQAMYRHDHRRQSTGGEAAKRRAKGEVARLRRTERLTPGLAVVLVGDDPASDIYVRSKAQQTEEAGMQSFVHRLPADVREETLF